MAALLRARPESPAVDTVVVRTTGDRLSDVPIDRIGGQGAFVKEVQAAVLSGQADLAVHSAKDLPSDTPPGLVLACVPERADPRDALVGRRLDELPSGARVATGSVRRRAQLAWHRPDLSFVELRGNMDTRLARAEALGAGVLALAALERLGLAGHVAEALDPSVLLPQVGQGALAVECRQDDDGALALLVAIDDPVAHRCLEAERAFLSVLGGGCTLPLGALAEPAGAGAAALRLRGLLASRDGHTMVRAEVEGHDPAELGARLAGMLLDDAGGRGLDDWGGS